MILVVPTAIIKGISLGLLYVSHATAGDIPLPFYDEAIDRGVAYLPLQGEFNDATFGCGLALVDLDDDGDPDLVCTGSLDGATGLFINDGTGQFTENTTSGLPVIPHASGVTAADYDGDGDLDLHFAAWRDGDKLFRNEGDLTFTDVTDEAGMSGALGAGSGAAWADYDDDGDLDLYVPNYSGSLFPVIWANEFWHNNGDGTFTEKAAELGLDDEWETYQVIWLDYDVDGDPDLYISNDRGSPMGALNRLFRNDGGTFTEVSDGSGTDVRISSMGVAVGDVDGNGHLDLYCTNNFGNPLLLNQGDGTFVDHMKEADVGSYLTGWGTHFFDFDNDADEDLYVCNMLGFNNLYRNPGSFPFEDVALYCNAYCLGDSYTVVTGDIDLDGDLDIIVQNYGELIKVLVNTEGDLRNSVKFDVRAPGANNRAVGARLVATSEGRVVVHEVAAGTSYKSTIDYVQHFGLDAAESLDSLEVRYPDGETRSFTDAPAGYTWKALHPDLLGDVDEDGDRDPVDLSAFVAAHQMPTFIQEWSWLDYTGDFFIDDSDILLFLEDYAGPLEDCDEDGTTDAVQIARGDFADVDLDGRIDDCPVPCPADFDGNGQVNGADLSMLLGAWATVNPEFDVNDDGVIDGADLSVILGAWGGC
ncbi:MAG: FG-GAP-like repeat-containing protein [Phycisphaerales bacterium]|nr:FG-GAP-like repeat-containing protein [Phycisphaerales bacterium]